MQVLAVAQVTAYLKDLLDDDPILSDVWVRGEITNLTKSSAGHIYFSVSDDRSQLSCVLFRGSQRGLLAAPRAGESVLVHGRIGIYEGRGQYQLYIDNLAPEGVGILQLEFEAMRRRLESDGLFASERKRSLPAIPRVIGIVTSPTGAVWHDIRNVIARRFPLVELIFAPSSVQGADAPAELIAALEALQSDGRSEVIILARGGGSAEDLACFNDERLARTIYASRVPVVSAVGHETDITIADLVADLRAPTPSAAAELCVPDSDELRHEVVVQVDAAGGAMARQHAASREQLLAVYSRIGHRRPMSRIDRSRLDIDFLFGRAAECVDRRISRARDLTGTLRLSADHLDPTAVLKRGYAVVSTVEARPRRIISLVDARAETGMTITFSDGSLRVKIDGENA